MVRPCAPTSALLPTPVRTSRIPTEPPALAYATAVAPEFQMQRKCAVDCGADMLATSLPLARCQTTSLLGSRAAAIV